MPVTQPVWPLSVPRSPVAESQNWPLGEMFSLPENVAIAFSNNSYPLFSLLGLPVMGELARPSMALLDLGFALGGVC
jgi:hypothetical protein